MRDAFKSPERLRELRKERKMTETELCEKLELGTSAIGMYEQSRRDTDSVISKKDDRPL